jgi:hypothetical protein
MMTMTRSQVRCSMGHTALFPGKNDARAWWAHETPRGKDIITISHGALDVLSILRHRGRILVCDIDPGVVASTHHMRGHGQGARYPHLNLTKPLCCDITLAVCAYIGSHGVKDLGVVDLDFACAVNEAWRLAAPTIEILSDEKYKGRVLLTFRNGRDGNGRDATDKRIDWIRAQLPKGVRVVAHRKYRSDWIGRYATRETGSSMCIVELKFG